jgi:3-hydroxybutyrate dehydrogenase
MTASTVDGIPAASGWTAEQAREGLERKQPIGRLIAPEEVAASVWSWVENGAMSGQGLNVEGGPSKHDY